MAKRILFSPIGTTDPIKNYRDGSMLHICRKYKPDKVYLYLSAEMMEHHKEDNRYVYCIEKLSEMIGKEIEVECIFRPELKNVQVYDVFYEDFRGIIRDIEKEMSDGDELIVNIASGTPAMKSALLVMAILSEYRFKPVQVSTPLGKSNLHGENSVEYDVETYWEMDEDNQENYEDRCIEAKSGNLIALLKIDSICKFINSYDYMAALTIAEEIDDFISNDDKMLINIAVERLKLNSKVVDKLLAQQKIDLIPVKSGNQRSLFEYALALEIKIKKGEYADFIRGLTPLTADLSELILKSQCNIDINDYCKVNRYGLRKFDTRKLNGTDIYETLQNEFDGNFKPNDVGTRQMVPLINKCSDDNVLKQKIMEIMDIEQAIRNLAAHEIVSVTEEWVKEKTGFSPRQIFELIKFLIVKAGVKVSKEDWESYDKMNEIIVSKVRGYETLHR